MADPAPVELPLACSLDTAALEAQLGRYRALGQSLAGHVREPQRLQIELAPGADLELLRETVAIERECCPFFVIELAEDALTIGVDDPSLAPALDAIEHSLGLAGC